MVWGGWWSRADGGVAAGVRAEEMPAGLTSRSPASLRPALCNALRTAPYYAPHHYALHDALPHLARPRLGHRDDDVVGGAGRLQRQRCLGQGNLHPGLVRSPISVVRAHAARRGLARALAPRHAVVGVARA